MPATSEEMIYSNTTKITGNSELSAVDVEVGAGKNRMLVESLFYFNTALQTATKTLTTSATKLSVDTNNLINRKGLIIQNVSNNTIYLGNASVTVLTGLALSAKNTQLYLAGANIDMYAIASSSSEIRIAEVS
jgi:hypothetical protein